MNRILLGRRGMATISLAALLAVVSMTAGGGLFGADIKEDGATARLVAGLVVSRHINHPEIDDDLSVALMDRYLRVWDPQKLYLMQSDVDEFRKFSRKLDDQIQAGEVGFSRMVFDRFMQRMDERAPLIDELIDSEFDFTVDEDIIRDPDDLTYCATEAEVRERWRKQIKYDMLQLRMDDELKDDPRDRLHRRYATNRSLLHQTEEHEILELYLSSMTHCLDPHSSYMSPRTLKEFQMHMELQLEGIGARLKFEDGYTVVDSILDGGAASADGRLEAGDKIIGVDSEGGENFNDVVGMKLTRVVDQIKGKASTKVRLQVQKVSGDIEEYQLTRQKVQLQDEEVKGQIIESSEWLEGGRRARIGILRIPSFYRDFRGAAVGGNFKSTSRDVKVILDKFNREGVDTLIVDLRWNGGGALAEAIEVTGLFIPRGAVVQVREPGNQVTSFADEDPDMAWRKPMVVVCNRYSASASEIFAGAIKDYRRGIVVGDRTTHGKGTVQNVMDVANRFSLFNSDRGALKLTISKFYRVNGDSTQTRGVESDIVLPSLLNHREIGEDSLDNALAFDRIPRAEFNPYTGFVMDSIVKELGNRSETRVKGDDEFGSLSRVIDAYLERRDRKTISLNEATLRAERKELMREKEAEEEAIKKASGNDSEDEIFPEDFYNRELINIAVDYLELFEGVSTARR